MDDKVMYEICKALVVISEELKRMNDLKEMDMENDAGDILADLPQHRV